jgi:hypothetical protein
MWGWCCWQLLLLLLLQCITNAAQHKLRLHAEPHSTAHMSQIIRQSSISKAWKGGREVQHMQNSVSRVAETWM